MNISDGSLVDVVFAISVVLLLGVAAIVLGLIIYEDITHYFGEPNIETIHDEVAGEWKVIYDCRGDWVVIGASDTESGADALADSLSERDDLNRFCDIRSSSEVQP